VVSGAGLLLVTLTACGGGNAGAAPAASSTPDISQFIACLHSHGVSVNGSDIPAIRTALRSVAKTQKKSAMSACRQYTGGIVGKAG